MTQSGRSSGNGWREEVAFFPGQDSSSLLGVLTSPTSTPLGIAVVVLTGGGFIGSTNRNRLNVRICRELAASGFHALRLDWHGVGDSTGTVDRFHVDRPFGEDVLGATSWLGKRGISRFLIVGTCFGGLSGLDAARSIDGLEGMLLDSLPIHSKPRGGAMRRLAEEWSLWDGLRWGLRPSKLFDLRHRNGRRTAWRFARAKWHSMIKRLREAPHTRRGKEGIVDLSWVSDDVLSSLEEVADRAPILVVYGQRDRSYEEFQRAQAGRLSGILRGGGIELEIIPGKVHGLQRVEAQEAVLHAVRRWTTAIATAADVASLRERSKESSVETST